MPRTPETNAIEDWRRFFAASFNNRAWDLAAESRDEAAEDELIDAAHAAAAHWRELGGPVNQMRAKLLVAHAHALRGWAEPAMAYAEKTRDLFQKRSSEGIEAEAWERALVEGVFAQASLVAGRRKDYEQAIAAARRAFNAIDKDVDRRIVAETLAQIPGSGVAAPAAE